MPQSNPWKLDLVKVIVLNLFIDVELIEVLARNYKKETRTVKGIDINPILVITRSCIEECFGLNRQALTKIDMEGYQVDYERM